MTTTTTDGLKQQAMGIETFCIDITRMGEIDRAARTTRAVETSQVNGLRVEAIGNNATTAIANGLNFDAG